MADVMAYVLWHVICLGRCYWQTLADVIPILYVVDVITTRQMVWPVMLSKVADIVCGRCYATQVYSCNCYVADLIPRWQIKKPNRVGEEAFGRCYSHK